MTGAPTAIDWRVGRLRIVLPIAIHGVALSAALELARERPMAWALVVGVLVSAAAECLAWIGERGRAHSLSLIAGGIGIGATQYGAKRAWFGPGCTAVWLRAAKQRRLIYVVCGEVAAADHAALRRHLKTLRLD